MFRQNALAVSLLPHQEQRAGSIPASAKMNEMGQSKELKNILEAISKWMDKHDGKVHFIGSFMAFKGKDFDVIDDTIVAYGIKDCIRDNLKELDTMAEQEKEDFINW